MLTSTTHSLEGRVIREYKGVFSAHCVEGLNALKDIASNISDFVGGRSGVMETAFAKADAKALGELVEAARSAGANALVGISFEHQIMHSQSSMLLVTVTGTAVVTSPRSERDKGIERPVTTTTEAGGREVLHEGERFDDSLDADDGVRQPHPGRDRVAFPDLPG